MKTVSLYFEGTEKDLNRLISLQKQEKLTEILGGYEVLSVHECEDELALSRAATDSIAQLTDFELVEASEKNVFLSSFTFKWRFDSQHRMRLDVSWQDGSAQIVQNYEDESPSEGLQSIQCLGRDFNLTQSDSGEWHCELSPGEVSVFAKVLKLAEPYRNWAHSVTTVKALQGQVQNGLVTIFLTAAQRKLIDYWSRVVDQTYIKINEILCDLLFTEQMVRGGGFLGGMELDCLNPLVSNIEKVGAKQLRLSLVWTSRPTRAPKVIVDFNEQPQPDVQYEWKNESLYLSHFNVSEKAEVGALLDQKTRKLRLSFK